MARMRHIYIYIIICIYYHIYDPGNTENIGFDPKSNNNNNNKQHQNEQKNKLENQKKNQGKNKKKQKENNTPAR